MSGIVPIPSTRLSTGLVNQLLTNSLQNNEQTFLQLEQQVSTGRNFQLLSQDPTAGLLGLQLQEQINNQTQVQTNLTTDQTYLSQTGTALTSVSNELSSIQSSVESALGSTATPASQQAAAQQVQNGLQQILTLANTQYQGRYLFAGSNSTTQPFQLVNGNVQYLGNTGSLNTYIDNNQLLATNIDGNTAFGAISSPIEGAALSPNVTLDTPLSTLNGGQGVDLGSIQIGDGSSTSVVDLSSAQTVGDVVNLLQANPPAGDTVLVNVTPTGLDVQLRSSNPSAALSISNYGGSTTASDLGIATTTAAASNQVTGSALNPALTLSTQLGDILGTSATATLTSAGSNNDIQIQAVGHGTALNNVAVSFATSSSVPPGQATVTYDDSNPSAPTLVVNINPSGATANAVVSAINSDPTVGQLFQASLVSGDSTSATAAGTGLIDPTITATTAGGSGTNLDLTDGLQISSGGQTYNVNLSSAKTIQDVLTAINQSGAGVQATINPQGTGINVVSNLSGANFSIGENGGTTATQLGLRTFTASTQLADLNLGSGVHTATTGFPDFTIQRPDGTSFSISLSGPPPAQTVGDVINLINNNADNPAGPDHITAQLATTGNGISLVSTDTTSNAAPFQVQVDSSSEAAQDLGLVAPGATTSSAATSGSGALTITGSDTNPQEVNGIFNTLSRLNTALQNNDTVEIQRDLGLLTQNQTQLQLAEAEVGSREQDFQSQQTTISNNLTTLQSSFSNTVDVNMDQTISNLDQAQLQYEAALQVTAMSSKLSLLNYL